MTSITLTRNVQSADLSLMIKLKHGDWNLTDLKDVPQNGLNIFSCFHGGGGSTMGYKLVGYNVLGGVEIDPKMMELYKTNHKPKHSYLMGVKEFCDIPDSELPKELFELDILDGSPPCSSFSMAGNREKNWGDKKKFREGQAKQVLDDLFFDFIDIAEKLQPKVVVAENVKGLIQGNARGYVKQIFKAFKDAGYSCQLFLLNAAFMGVPQRRERVFFVANRIDAPDLVLDFCEKPIAIKNAIKNKAPRNSKPMSNKSKPFWESTSLGGLFSGCGAETGKMNRRTHPNKPSWTITSSASTYHWNEPRLLQGKELVAIQTFPQDYNFIKQNVGYVCGMSVPPFMMQRIAIEIQKQWLKKV